MHGFFSVRRIRFTWSALLMGLLMVGGSPSFAQDAEAAPQIKEWNTEEVKVLANQLVEELKEARLRIRQEPNIKSLTSGSGRRAVQFEDAVKALEKSARQYATRVEKDADRADTVSIARKVGLQLRTCEQLSRQLPLSKPTTDALAAAHRTLNALAPYYGSAPLYPEADATPEQTP